MMAITHDWDNVADALKLQTTIRSHSVNTWLHTRCYGFSALHDGSDLTVCWNGTVVHATKYCLDDLIMA